MHPRPQAAPTPALCTRGEPGANGIPLDVPQYGQQRLAVLNWEALESSLIERTMPHGPMRDPPAHRVRVRQPSEEVGELSVCLGPDDKVPMVGQDAVRQNADRMSRVRFDDDALERLEVGVFAER